MNCSLKSCGLIISFLYLLVHGLLLGLLIVLMTDPQHHIDTMMSVIDTRDGKLRDSSFYSLVTLYTGQSEYLALPITIDIVLIVANIMMCAGSVFNHSLMVIPWLLLYTIVNMFFTGLLIYIMMILQDSWLQTICFLLVAPVLIIAAALWVTVFRLYLQLRGQGSKMMRGGQLASIPPTVYTPQPHSWDSPLPIWSLSPLAPAQATWDPVYLQQYDPRYATSHPSMVSDYSDSYHGHYSEVSGASSRQVDTVSLSSKYGGGVMDNDEDDHDQDESVSDDTSEGDINTGDLVTVNTQNYDVRL